MSHWARETRINQLKKNHRDHLAQFCHVTWQACARTSILIACLCQFIDQYLMWSLLLINAVLCVRSTVAIYLLFWTILFYFKNKICITMKHATDNSNPWMRRHYFTKTITVNNCFWWETEKTRQSQACVICACKKRTGSQFFGEFALLRSYLLVKKFSERK